MARINPLLILLAVWHRMEPDHTRGTKSEMCAKLLANHTVVLKIILRPIAKY